MKADQIQNLRKCLSITQDELAKKVGVSLRTVKRWESGAATPHPRTRRALKALQSPMLPMLGLLEQEPPTEDELREIGRIAYLCGTPDQKREWLMLIRRQGNP